MLNDMLSVILDAGLDGMLSNILHAGLDDMLCDGLSRELPERP